MTDPATGAVRIRFATPADAAAMLAIFNREVVNSTASWEWFPLSGEDWRAWFVEHTRDDHVLLVAELGGQVVGFAGYGSFRAKDGYATTVEDSVFLNQGARGHGLGTQLLLRLLDEARARGVHSMVAAITGENAASLGLHTALGFTRAGFLPQAGHKFGRRLDLNLLQIILDDRPVPPGPADPARPQ
jgi:phosphinothricin acetyltransferase